MFVLSTAGHVDHGKSTFLKSLTGMAVDKLAEEKRRGMTMDLNFVHFPSERGEVGIVDVPGHAKYSRNMVCGVAPVDAFLFVVAADDGWMPQSEEHLRILTAMGVTRGIVILTKVDLVDAAQVQAVGEQIAARMGLAFGAPTPILPFSIKQPELLPAIRLAIAELVGTLPEPQQEKSPRLWIDRAFTPRGRSVVVTGTLREGEIAVGQELYLWPGVKPVKVRALQSYGQAAERIAPNARVAVEIIGAHETELIRGALLQGKPAFVSKVSDVSLNFFRTALVRGQEVTLHFGSLREPVKLIPLSPAEGIYRIKCSRPLPLRYGDRFALRPHGEEYVLAAGLVVNANPPLPHLAARKVLAGKPFGKESWFRLASENGRGESPSAADLSHSSVFAQSAFIDLIARERPRAVRQLVSSAPSTPTTPSAAEVQVMQLLASEVVPQPIAILLARGANRDAIFSCAKSRLIIQCSDLHFIGRSNYEALKQKVETFIRGKQPATTSELKGVLGDFSRKHALLVLERMDADRLTYLKDGARYLYQPT